MSVLSEPELHIIGELEGGSYFDHDNAFCVFQLNAGESWTLVGGDVKGQTQVDYPSDGSMFVWNHPIDVHYFTNSLLHWPSVFVEVWGLDSYGEKQLIGYATGSVPKESGEHCVRLPVWRPIANTHQEKLDYFLASGCRLVDPKIAYDIDMCKQARHRLVTKSVGYVHLKLSVLLRNTVLHNVSTSKLDAVKHIVTTLPQVLESKTVSGFIDSDEKKTGSDMQVTSLDVGSGKSLAMPLDNSFMGPSLNEGTLSARSVDSNSSFGGSVATNNGYHNSQAYSNLDQPQSPHNFGSANRNGSQSTLNNRTHNNGHNHIIGNPTLHRSNPPSTTTNPLAHPRS